MIQKIFIKSRKIFLLFENNAYLCNIIIRAMEKHTYKSDVWAIFPAVGIYADKNEVELHIQWLRTNLVLTFKKKKQ